METEDKARWTREHVVEALRDPRTWQGQTIEQLYALARKRKNCPFLLTATDLKDAVFDLVTTKTASFRKPDVAFLTKEQLDVAGGPKRAAWDLLNCGAIAMLDALGFRGIWRGAHGQRDLRALATLRWTEQAAREAERTAQVQVENLPNGWRDVPFKVGTMSLSDTLILHVGVPEEFAPTKEALTTAQVDPASYRESLNGLALLSVVRMVAAALRTAVSAPRPLAFRGTIAVGPYLVEPPFLIGECVDDSAEQMEHAEGPFVWLRPSALAVRQTWETFGGEWHRLAREYVVPLKCGNSVNSRVVDPGADAEGIAYWRAVLATMPEDDPKLVEKRRETEKFARHLVASQDEAAKQIILGRVVPSPYRGAAWD